MNPDWLKSQSEDYWTAQLEPYQGSVARIMFGTHSWAVGDATRQLRGGNVETLEVAQMAAEAAAKELSAEG